VAAIEGENLIWRWLALLPRASLVLDAVVAGPDDEYREARAAEQLLGNVKP
jgi:hypothetical protein